MTQPSTPRRFEWTMALTLIAPFTTGGTENAERGVDDAQLRDEDGKPLVAGTHLQGLFRHFLNDVHRAESNEDLPEEEKLVPRGIFLDWFGRPAKQLINAEELEDLADIYSADQLPGVADDNLRGRLTFRDLILETDESDGRHDRDRIRIDQDRRSVRPGAWLTSEQMFPTGTMANYISANGYSIVLYGSEQEANLFDAAFEQFIRSLPSIGGDKGAGFGRVSHLSIERSSAQPLSLPATGPALQAGTMVGCRFELAQPLLIDPTLLSGNLQRSSVDIPGGALKAAIAEFGRRADPANFDKEFGDVLSRLVIRHAQAVPAGSRFRRKTFPYTLVAMAGTDGSQHFADAFDPEAGEPIFEVNFKRQHEEILSGYYEAFSFAPVLVTRTRTAIERHKFTADPHRLFNYQSVSPRGIEWITEFVIPDDFDQNDLARAGQLLAFLRSGFIQIGKLRSEIVNVAFAAGTASRAAKHCGVDGGASPATWRMKIDAPAYLLGIDALQKLQGGADLRDVYRERLREIIAGVNPRAAGAVDWTRLDFLAQHAWSGGRRAVRYKQQDDDGYYPYLLTQPGSVFLLIEKADIGESDRDALREALSRLAAFGLPAARIGATWEICPFVPQNGYGEVTVDDADLSIARSRLEVNADA